MQFTDLVNYLKEQKGRVKLREPLDVEKLCADTEMTRQQFIELLFALCFSELRKVTRLTDKCLNQEREINYLQKTIEELCSNNGNMIQKMKVRNGLPIAKKRNNIAELRLLIKLGNTDEELMQNFGISRTTLWRWKKELRELERQGKL